MCFHDHEAAEHHRYRRFLSWNQSSSDLVDMVRCINDAGTWAGLKAASVMGDTTPVGKARIGVVVSVGLVVLADMGWVDQRWMGLSSGVVGSSVKTDFRCPWFHHCVSKPLSTVIMAADRAPRSFVRPVSRSRVRTGEEDASGEKVETMVGFVANVVEFRSAGSALVGTCS
jgi:hypothetical protein